jgi:chitin disaccharide deacetylase
MQDNFNYHNNQIILNADDFGYDPIVNLAIYQSFQQGLIYSTSMIANLEGFEDGVKMFHAEPSLFKNTGIHFNLTEGYPLSDSIKSCRLFCDESGKFIFKRQKPLFYLSKQEKKAVYFELKAQMEKLCAAGIQPVHIDSHHHIHTEWPIMKQVIRLAKEHGIQKIRVARNMGEQRSRFKMMYKNILNYYLKSVAGLANSDLFGDLTDFEVLVEQKYTINKKIELMVHPKMNPDRQFIEDNGKNLQDILYPFIPGPETNI